MQRCGLNEGSRNARQAFHRALFPACLVLFAFEMGFPCVALASLELAI